MRRCVWSRNLKNEEALAHWGVGGYCAKNKQTILQENSKTRHLITVFIGKCTGRILRCCIQYFPQLPRTIHSLLYQLNYTLTEDVSATLNNQHGHHKLCNVRWDRQHITLVLKIGVRISAPLLSVCQMLTVKFPGRRQAILTEDFRVFIKSLQVMAWMAKQFRPKPLTFSVISNILKALTSYLIF